MKRKLLILILTLGLATPASLLAQEDPAYTKVGIGVELLGAGGLYAIMASFRFFKPLAINVGFSSLTVSGSTSSTTTTATTDATFTIIPIYASYILGTRHSLEVLGGVDIVSGTATTSSSSGTSNFTGSGALPVAGVGYRFAPSTHGFFFRATAYIFFGKETTCTTDSSGNTSCSSGSTKIFPWGGITVGYAFWSSK